MCPCDKFYARYGGDASRARRTPTPTRGLPFACHVPRAHARAPPHTCRPTAGNTCRTAFSAGMHYDAQKQGPLANVMRHNALVGVGTQRCRALEAQRDSVVALVHVVFAEGGAHPLGLWLSATALRGTSCGPPRRGRLVRTALQGASVYLTVRRGVVVRGCAAANTSLADVMRHDALVGVRRTRCGM